MADKYPPALMSHRETDDDYAKVIAQLGPKNRLIECKDSLQWILQAKVGKRWLSEKFLTSRDGVLRYAAGLPGSEALKDLPERFRTRSVRADGADGATK